MIEMYATARIVNFPAEMFNDALYFLEEAKKIGPVSGNDWLRWRYLRASILFSFSCIEAYVNLLIISRAEKLGLMDVATNIKNGNIRLESKIDTIYSSLLGKPIDKSETHWKYFKDIKKIRNEISHYTGGTKIYNDDEEYGINISNAEKGVEMVRLMIRYLTEISDISCPGWINPTESRIIK